MRRESSTVVALVGEVGEGLLAELSRSPNVSIARAPGAGTGQPDAAEPPGARPGWEAGALALREAARRVSAYVVVPGDPLAEVAAGLRGVWGVAGTPGARRVRGKRRGCADGLAGQAVRTARLLPGRGRGAARWHRPGPVPGPVAGRAAAPGRRRRPRRAPRPGRPGAGRAQVPGTRAVVAAA